MATNQIHRSLRQLEGPRGSLDKKRRERSHTLIGIAVILVLMLLALASANSTKASDDFAPQSNYMQLPTGEIALVESTK